MKLSGTRTHGIAVGVLLLLYAVLTGWLAWRSSPVIDEVGHLPAGLYSWRYGGFEAYRVNPPLVRMPAAVPVLAAGADMNWRSWEFGLTARPEWPLGQAFLRANPDGWHWYFVLARWAVIPLGMIGGFVCYRWARDLFGRAAGLLALTLWCICPNVLAWGATILPDVPAASLGALAGYCFWRWLEQPRWRFALAAGATLGLALLTKFTWVILFGLWPVLAVMWFAGRQSSGAQVRQLRLGQLASILLLGLYVLNLGYAFDGFCRALGDYKFASRLLADSGSPLDGGTGGNRFGGTWAGAMPVPLPSQYLLGVDLQRHIYRLTPEAVARARHSMGLPPLPSQ